ncbi:MAG: type IV pilin [Salinirussus sp.]
MLPRLLAEDDAVSPVIGVVLMVAITVILAAVMATFVLSFGEQVSGDVPQASFSFDQNRTNSPIGVTITHESGATLDGDRISVLGPASADLQKGFPDSEIAAGDTAEVTGLSAGDQIRVVWTSADGSQSTVLGTYTVN